MRMQCAWYCVASRHFTNINWCSWTSLYIVQTLFFPLYPKILVFCFPGLCLHFFTYKHIWSLYFYKIYKPYMKKKNLKIFSFWDWFSLNQYSQLNPFICRQHNTIFFNGWNVQMYACTTFPFPFYCCWKPSLVP